MSALESTPANVQQIMKIRVSVQQQTKGISQDPLRWKLIGRPLNCKRIVQLCLSLLEFVPYLELADSLDKPTRLLAKQELRELGKSLKGIKNKEGLEWLVSMEKILRVAIIQQNALLGNTVLPELATDYSKNFAAYQLFKIQRDEEILETQMERPIARSERVVKTAESYETQAKAYSELMETSERLRMECVDSCEKLIENYRDANWEKPKEELDKLLSEASIESKNELRAIAISRHKIERLSQDLSQQRRMYEYVNDRARGKRDELARLFDDIQQQQEKKEQLAEQHRRWAEQHQKVIQGTTGGSVPGKYEKVIKVLRCNLVLQRNFVNYLFRSQLEKSHGTLAKSILAYRIALGALHANGNEDAVKSLFFVPLELAIDGKTWCLKVAEDILIPLPSDAELQSGAMEPNDEIIQLQNLMSKVRRAILDIELPSKLAEI